MRNVNDDTRPAAPTLMSTADMSTTTTQVLTQINAHYARLGGEPAVRRLVDAFYQRMETLPEAQTIRAMHPAELAPVKETLVRYLGEWLGGPALYSSERGHPRLRRRHLPFRIGEAERDAWLLCMRGALDAVSTDAALKEELIAAFFRTADFIRNDAGTTHTPHRSPA